MKIASALRLNTDQDLQWSIRMMVVGVPGDGDDLWVFMAGDWRVSDRGEYWEVWDESEAYFGHCSCCFPLSRWHVVLVG